MASKKYHTPDLSNAKPGGLADMLADAREKMNEAKFYEGFYKEALKARWEDKTRPIQGERFCAERKVIPTERFDVTSLRAAAAAGDEVCAKLIDRFTINDVQERIETKEIAKVNKVLAPASVK